MAKSKLKRMWWVVKPLVYFLLAAGVVMAVDCGIDERYGAMGLIYAVCGTAAAAVICVAVLVAYLVAVERWKESEEAR